MGVMPWSAARAAELIEQYRSQAGPCLPILHALQEEFGHVPSEAVPMVAEALNLSRAEVHGVVSFYHEFRRTPPGRHVLKLCRAEACQSVGTDRLAAEVKAHFGIGFHETTADGKLTLEPVFCLGNCACGPAAMLDDRVLGRVDLKKIEQHLARHVAEERKA
ncbi:MAG TPA: formate dehydrogenase subunit gamma [Hypericibacter adhaerens]|jgi:formate dehydrogenase subunit gamma|uniref:Formate dehydrogenase subunit gamma n=1 Tax=Hypericibacter adhaerens TaxID=2602016 RepID=A0A5J6MSL9_9PROT|nr:formate dehydrogenase subunit gamma [Hypericibacter adhaerens]QEX20271.1 formate dehydrogenase subunit gamma [Hypericibacter adhaerens]HWA45332.1 formate dehydrogenase subunit gamma [Hypericibacter adhaerens]